MRKIWFKRTKPVVKFKKGNYRKRKRARKFIRKFFNIENNQKLFIYKLKNLKVIKNIFSSLTAINFANQTYKSFTIMYSYPYLLSAISLLHQYCYIFTYYLINIPEESQLRYLTKGWPLGHKAFEVVKWNRNRQLSFANFVILFYRKSIYYKIGFNKLRVLSTKSRTVYYTKQKLIKILNQFMFDTQKIFFINTQNGLVNHFEAVSIKCGGSILFCVE